MKIGWRTKTLGEVCQFVGGSQPPKSIFSKTKQPDYVRLIQIRDYKSDDHVVFIPRKQARRFCATNDIMIGRYGPPVFQILRGLEGAYNVALMKAVPDEAKLLRDYLFYFLQSPDIQHHVIGLSERAAGQSGLNKETLEPYPLLLPPLPEQQRIVGIIDEAFEGIATAKANTEKNLQKAHALFESHLQSVFAQRGEGWVDTTIGQCIRFIDYRGKTPVNTESGLRLITAKNVKMGYLQETPMEFIAPESYDGWMTRGIPNMGDVLFTTEAPLANVAQLDTDEKVAFAQRIIIMQPEKSILDSTFLKYLLLSRPIQQRIRAKGTGATVQGIKASLLKLIDISFPSDLSVQRSFVDKLDALSDETQRLASIYQQKLAALDELKKSLLHQAFSCQL